MKKIPTTIPEIIQWLKNEGIYNKPEPPEPDFIKIAEHRLARIEKFKAKFAKYEDTGWIIPERTAQMASTLAAEVDMFTVFKAANGFYARTNRGVLVIGATLSEVCTAACAAVTEAAIAGEDDDEPPAGLSQAVQSPWLKVK